MAWLQMFTLGLLIDFTARSLASPVPSPNATQDWNFPQIPSSTNLTWYPCYSGHFCAMLDVPLDYLNPQLGRASVPIIKKPATTTPYRGILFLNPGGPGDSGVTFLLTVPDSVLETVGSNYDLASWEPRGMGYSVPVVNSCQPPDSPATTLSSTTAKLRRQTHDMDIVHGPNLPLESLGSNTTYVSSGENCAIYMGGPLDAGPHMTTATVARDLISILDAYALTTDALKAEQDPKLLNYWGFSYGTMIGQTFASMFPSRLGRIVIDGVMNAESWTSGGFLSGAVDEDAVFATFFQYCHFAGPEQCPFYTGITPHDIYLRFEAMISRLNVTQATEQGWSNATAIEIAVRYVQYGLDSGAYTPIDRFPSLGTALVTVETITSNLTIATAQSLRSLLGLQNSILGPGDPGPLAAVINRFTAVACTDTGGLFYNSSFAEYAKRLPVLQKQSWIGGNSVWGQLLPCLSWGIRSDDVFSGPFGGRTDRPMLVVSNTLDPVTPIMNGKKSARIFSNAELLTIEGTGHTSLGSQNACASKKIGAFFQTGTLPGEDNYCPLEAGPWNITFAGPLDKRAELMEIGKRLRELRGRWVA
ncbi:hypothetical protein N431DRAFT_376208 [Stipitochalara longipes BDJ]|nr:hypothetical protein N431DRAFT_376208 [Stipitochalara longipes BDJ]